MRTRIICFGNPIMTDDGVGVHVARGLREKLAAAATDIDVVESAVAGLALLDLMAGWERVVLVDAIQLPDHKPGDVVRLDPNKGPLSLRLCSVHELDVSTVLQVGPQMGFQMPTQVVLVAVQASDLCTFGDKLSAAVQAAIPRAIEIVLAEAGLS
jgi:hydrogenase maturation protease